MKKMKISPEELHSIIKASIIKDENISIICDYDLADAVLEYTKDFCFDSQYIELYTKNNEYIITFNYYDYESNLSIESLKTPKGIMKEHEVDGVTYVFGDFNIFEINKNIKCHCIMYCELEDELGYDDCDVEDYNQNIKCTCDDCMGKYGYYEDDEECQCKDDEACEDCETEGIYITELIDDYFNVLFDDGVCCEECEMKYKKLLVDLYFQGVEDILENKELLRDLIKFNDEFNIKH